MAQFLSQSDLTESHESKVDLMPMIDLTFLLVMFFVLTSTFTSLNLEEVLLPVALKASDQRKGSDTVLIVNVRRTNDENRDGEIVFNGAAQSLAELVKALRLEVDFDASRNGMEASDGKGGPQMSRIEVRVRPDEGVRAELLRKVFTACQKVGIYKVKLSALKP